jgi:hypothetical protein
MKPNTTAPRQAMQLSHKVSQGLQALHSGHSKQALDYFDFAILENPHCGAEIYRLLVFADVERPSKKPLCSYYYQFGPLFEREYSSQYRIEALKNVLRRHPECAAITAEMLEMQSRREVPPPPYSAIDPRGNGSE